MKREVDSWTYKAGLAVLLVFLASVVRTIVHHIWHEDIVYTPFYPAIIISTMIGRWRVGLFATSLACLAASFWLDPFGKPLIVELSDLVEMVLFLSVSVLVVWLCERMLRAQKQAESAAEERRSLLVAEQEARAAAEAANRLKDEFVASVSHELRTPLQAILGWSEVIRVGNCDSVAAAPAIESIQRNARLQSQLIEDLLDISRIVSGKMRLDVKVVRLVDVVEAAIDTLTPASRAKELEVKRRFDALETMVWGDAGRLQQIVWNLLSNAIKFTPREGRIDVRIFNEHDQAVIDVADTGSGIDPEFLPFVFERFRQADGKPNRRYAGLGIGLSIVKNLAELHGGTVMAQSDGAGRGATFRVRLPLARAEAFTGDINGQQAPRGRSLDGVRVLVVDDDSDTCALVKHVLEQCRATVITATSCGAALEMCETWKPDLLISDLGMPEHDGYELITAVRNRASNVPAIAFTAYASEEERRRSLESGFQLHLAKPIEPGAFAGAIADVVRRTAK